MRSRLASMVAASLSLVFIFAAVAVAEEHPVAPYVDPSQLDVPFPKHSHYRQPWRGFLETRSGDEFLRGVGINYNVPGNDDLAVRVLAEAGFRHFRIEIGWGNVRWDELGLTNDARMRHLLKLCRQYRIRPLILLNAHQGVPCPLRFFSKRLAAPAAQGTRVVKLTDTQDLVAGRSGINGQTAYWAAETLLTKIDPATGECQLSKPLASAIPLGGEVKMATLKYAPLYPVGTPEFDATAEGWVKYARLVCQIVREAGVEDFDVEIWNELTFGTEFLNINNYYKPDLVQFKGDFLHEGGRCWEIARRTVQAVKQANPNIRCIWGFSNTTFFHTPIEKLPPGIDGQSYHPYGTGTRKLPEQEYHRDQPAENVDGFTPKVELRMPEGWAHTFIQTESLIRLINPEARRRHPLGTERFLHVMTEHGVAPPECGVVDEAGAWDLKAKCALRSFCMYLNKGVTWLDFFSAYEDKATGMGILPADLLTHKAGAPLRHVTRPIEAVQRLTRAFAGSVPIREPKTLDIAVTELGVPQSIFEGDATHPPLWQRDVFAVLPFQLTEDRFLIAAYVATYDATRPMAEAHYRLKIRGLPHKPTKVRLLDPMTGRDTPIQAVGAGDNGIEVEIPVVDYPRLLTIAK